MNNTNFMRDLMLTGFELSKISGVPMLYLGNPGMGKTTIVNLWAKRNGYHVVLCDYNENAPGVQLADTLPQP